MTVEYKCPIGDETLVGTPEQASLGVPCRDHFEEDNGADCEWLQCRKGCHAAFMSESARDDHEYNDHTA